MGLDVFGLRTPMRELCPFAVILKRAVSSGRINFHPQHSSLTLVPPPSAVDIPMQPIDSTYQLPLPFHSIYTDPYIVEDPWTVWLSRHIEKMSEPDQLGKGQWCGYYSYDGARAFDPPMLGIQFSVDQNPSPGSGLTSRIRAQGHDGIGQFTLEGGISRQGELRLRKTYAGAHSFDWTCFMTPFGIFGRWGTVGRNIFRQGGKLWLWKCEWNSS